MIDAIVLAGGRSSRMGTDKARLMLDGRRLIERVVAECNKVAQRTFVVADAPSRFADIPLDATLVRDSFPGTGPLGGLHAGLTRTEHDAVIVVACDMPFIDAEVIALMASAFNGCDAFVPRVDGRLHPIHAVYSPAVLPTVEELAVGPDRSMHALLARLNVIAYEPSGLALDRLKRSLTNVNSPAEFKALHSAIPR
jgi:molybdenum cofactor guanylyltransferase